MSRSAESIAGVLAAARRRLADRPDSTASGAREAEVLLAHVLGVSRAWLFANRERSLPTGDARRFLALLERPGGVPVATWSAGANSGPCP
jgi:release factor glutamine methyltransferase